MSTKAKIIIALVVVAIIVGVSIFIYNKKKKAKFEADKKAASTSGKTEVAATTVVKGTATEATVIDFKNTEA